MCIALKGLLWCVLNPPLADSATHTLPTIAAYTDKKRGYNNSYNIADVW